MTSTSEAVLFWILAPISVLAALGLLFARKAVYAALTMAVVMVNLGVLYLALSAPFLGIIQVFVYTGAVMMLFLFVLMLIGVDSSDSLVETLRGQRVVALLLSLGLAALLIPVIGRVTVADQLPGDPASVTESGHVNAMAELIFGKYVWVFEVTSALLITAALGAMILAHRERLGQRPSQRAWAARRVREGIHVAGLPAPGVYARHNAVDTPALLPDGSVADLSVSRVLAARDQITAPAGYAEIEAGIRQEIEEGSQR